MLNDIVSLEDAATAIGCTYRRITQLVRSGELVRGHFRGTVTLQSVAKRQRLLKLGKIRRGPRKKRK